VSGRGQANLVPQHDQLTVAVTGATSHRRMVSGDYVPGLRRPLELDTARARRDLGWAPEFSSRAALAAARRALGL
jgi:nucleoside-diphosphate-sugar epimerase